jgi:hypothetical protein
LAGFDKSPDAGWAVGLSVQDRQNYQRRARISKRDPAIKPPGKFLFVESNSEILGLDERKNDLSGMRVSLVQCNSGSVQQAV